MMKYDVDLGLFINAFPELSKKDLTAAALEGDRGRRFFVGCSNGELVLVNFISGLIVDRLMLHNKDITNIVPFKTSRNRVYTIAIYHLKVVVFHFFLYFPIII